jgi:hypothetical protein
VQDEPDWYAVLGVEPGADAASMRRAYLALARRHHPDAQGDLPTAQRISAEDAMRRVNEAWAVLGDPARRRAYDEARVERRRRAWTPGTVAPDFVPFDDGDDPEDPAAEFDVPYGDGTPVHRGLQVGPLVVAVLGLLALGAGSLLGFGPLLALGLAGLVLSVVLFAATPLYAIMRSHATTRD